MNDVPKHHIVEPRFRSFVLANAELELLFDQARWLEGPVWFADHGSLLVSDVPPSSRQSCRRRCTASICATGRSPSWRMISKGRTACAFRPMRNGSTSRRAEL
ncbi:sugar lactone lactonase YvrE [Variovorax sp. GrIS 2.14]